MKIEGVDNLVLVAFGGLAPGAAFYHEGHARWYRRAWDKPVAERLPCPESGPPEIFWAGEPVLAQIDDVASYGLLNRFEYEGVLRGAPTSRGPVTVYAHEVVQNRRGGVIERRVEIQYTRPDGPAPHGIAEPRFSVLPAGYLTGAFVPALDEETEEEHAF